MRMSGMFMVEEGFVGFEGVFVKVVVIHPFEKYGYNSLSLINVFNAKYQPICFGLIVTGVF